MSNLMKNNNNKINIHLKNIFDCNLSNLKKELVCCIYNENINWIQNELNNYDKIYLYCKKKERFNEIYKKYSNYKTTVINLENIGTCDYAYLYHIINNYDNLLNIIDFHKGSENKKKKFYIYNLEKKKAKKIKIKKLRKFNLKKYSFSNKVNIETNNFFYKSEFENLNKYLLFLFDKETVNNLFNNHRYVIYGGNFIVNVSNIHRYDKEIYEKLINYDCKFPNREIDHFYERIWGLLFSNNLYNPFVEYPKYI